MNWRDTLEREFNTQDSSFLIRLRIALVWDRNAFERMVGTMEQCAQELEE